MTSCSHVQNTLLGPYQENALPDDERAVVRDHLDACAECAREEREMARMLHLLHTRVGRHEPRLDLWAEFAPKMAAVQAEERLPLPERLRRRAATFWGNVALGAILFTQAVALNTAQHLQKYLLVDPFLDPEENT
jgi:anti-sigma factor RsiW